MSGNLINEAVNIWNSAVAFLRDRRKCAEIRRDLARLGPEECRQMLADYGMTPREFDEALQIPFASEDLSSAALRSVGVDPQAFHREHGVRSRAIRRTCMTCHAKYRCRKDLATGGFGRNYQDYCPNRLHFTVLLARQPYKAKPSN